MTKIGMENVIDVESLSTEFRCIRLGRRIAEFVSRHPHVEVIRLKSAITDLQSASSARVQRRMGRKRWQEVAHQENNMQLNGICMVFKSLLSISMSMKCEEV
jgi:hypothetical protein